MAKRRPGSVKGGGKAPQEGRKEQEGQEEGEDLIVIHVFNSSGVEETSSSEDDRNGSRLRRALKRTVRQGQSILAQLKPTAAADGATPAAASPAAATPAAAGGPTASWGKRPAGTWPRKCFRCGQMSWWGK